MPNLEFIIAMPAPHTHLFEVEVRVQSPPSPLVFELPAWTPGSYLIREYARHIQNVTAHDGDGQALPVQKVSKAGWEVDFKGATTVSLTYKVYAHELTVRTSHLDATHGYFNGATVFACPVGAEAWPSVLEVRPADHWKVSVALPSAGDHRFNVKDFDQLVDSPVECGPHEEVHFDAQNVTHRWVNWGHDFDVRPHVSDVVKLIDKEVELFGGLPDDLDDYLFICHVQERRNGGLEHKKSQTLGIDRRTPHHARAYEDFITLVAHEYFHVWNVKRIRPEGLGPFDYSKEAYTPLLWMMEGITGYYDTLIPVRAGLMTTERYLEILGERIGVLRSQPGRFVRSLEESSMDAWIKLYRPDENTPNSTISYYLKGELVALLLDFTIRERTQGTKSLDDVMRFLWQRQQDTGQAISPDEVEAIFQEAVGLDLGPEIQEWTRERADLPYTEVFQKLGLQLQGSHKKTYDRSLIGGTLKSPAPFVGITTQASGGRTLLKHVLAGSPAENAGLCPGDELIAMDTHRVNHSSWGPTLALYQASSTVDVLVARRDRLVQVQLTLGAPRCDTFKVRSADDIGDPQRELLEGWCQQSWPTS